MGTGHVYHRCLDPNGQDSLAKLARLVRPGSQVLDLGTGPGVLGRYLKEQLDCAVDGVEYNPTAIAEAAAWYRRLECADLEQLKLVERFAVHQYDYILCADVLEHLRQPGALLSQLSELLAPSGQVLISIPNVAYAGLIADLLAGEFRYRPEGLLDETHLRFFTLASLYRLLNEHGLHAIAVDAALRDWRESEFTERMPDALPPALTRALLGRPEALVYQFIVTAVTVAEAKRNAPPVFASPPPELRFNCQLFWRSTDAGYQESESVVAWGRLGEARQTVRLAIPARSAVPEKLRLDVADRPGIMRLYTLTLSAKNGQLLWAWNGRRASLASQPHWQLVFADLDPAMTGVTLLSAGDDPGLELPIPALALAGLQDGGVLDLEVTWPMSLDYLALVQNCIPRQDAETARAEWMRQTQDFQSRIMALTERNSALETEAVARGKHETEREREFMARIQQLERESTAWQARLNEQAAELARLQGLLRRSWRERLGGRLQRWFRR